MSTKSENDSHLEEDLDDDKLDDEPERAPDTVEGLKALIAQHTEDLLHKQNAANKATEARQRAEVQLALTELLIEKGCVDVDSARDAIQRGEHSFLIDDEQGVLSVATPTGSTPATPELLIERLRRASPSLFERPGRGKKRQRPGETTSRYDRFREELSEIR